jgi:outer membrane lipoprotein LolB
MLKFLSLISILFILSGCASQIAPPLDRPTHQPRTWLKPRIYQSDLNWDIQGSISIQQRDKMQMATFTWKQIDSRYAINFYGPLNLGAIGIAGQPGNVTLNKPTASFSAPTAESLMQQQLGWFLPVSNMYYWVRGQAAPNSIKSQTKDQDGHLVYLQQQGWIIQFDAYRPEGDTVLPHKIWMENQSLRVKIVINRWDFSRCR